MANTIVEIQLPSGVTATLSLYADGSDTLANTGGADALTEQTNRKGLYLATVTEALAGLYWAKVLIGSNVLASGWVVLADDTGTYSVSEEKPTAEWANGGRLDTKADAVKAKTDLIVSAATLAELVEAYIVNDGDATAVMQAIADKIAADWVAGDASPLAIISALKADEEWSNLATMASLINSLGTAVASNGTDIGDVQTQIASLNDISLGDVGSALSTTESGIAAIDAIVNAIKEKTDNTFQYGDTMSRAKQSADADTLVETVTKSS